MGWGEREPKINGLGELSFRRRDPVTPGTEKVEDEAVPDWPWERGGHPPTEADRRRDGGRQARYLGKKAGVSLNPWGKTVQAGCGDWWASGSVQVKAKDVENEH